MNDGENFGDEGFEMVSKFRRLKSRSEYNLQKNRCVNVNTQSIFLQLFHFSLIAMNYCRFFFNVKSKYHLDHFVIRPIK